MLIAIVQLNKVTTKKRIYLLVSIIVSLFRNTLSYRVYFSIVNPAESVVLSNLLPYEY